MLGWNELFFTPGEFQPDKRQSAEWNRGAYLVEGSVIAAPATRPRTRSAQPRRPKGTRAGKSGTGSRLAWQLTGVGPWIVGHGGHSPFFKTGRNDRTTAYGQWPR